MAGGQRGGIQYGGDLRAREPLRNGHLMLDLRAVAQNLQYLGNTGMGREQILTRPQLPLLAGNIGGEAEDERMLDDPGLRQRLRHRAVTAAGYDQVLAALPRTRRGIGLVSRPLPEPERHQQDQQDQKNPARPSQGWNQETRLNRMEALVPPKPKLFDSTTSILRSCAVSATRS